MKAMKNILKVRGIREYILKTGLSPSYKELKIIFNVKSNKAVAYQLKKLEGLGFILREQKDKLGRGKKIVVTNKIADFEPIYPAEIQNKQLKNNEEQTRFDNSGTIVNSTGQQIITNRFNNNFTSSKGNHK